MNNEYDYYKQNDPINQFVSSFQELWCDFLINHNRLCEKLTEANYELLYRFAEEVITPMSFTIITNFAKSLERERLQQKYKDSHLIPLN